jgi:hypothetical protein
MEQGGPQIVDGGRASGPPLYDSADQGWTLQMETSFNDRRGAPADADRRLLVYRYYVDHVGLGRKDALPMYLDALKAAGLDASLGPIHPGASKQVVWLAGRYDSVGRRLD